MINTCARQPKLSWPYNIVSDASHHVHILLLLLLDHGALVCERLLLVRSSSNGSRGGLASIASDQSSVGGAERGQCERLRRRRDAWPEGSPCLELGNVVHETGVCGGGLVQGTQQRTREAGAHHLGQIDLLKLTLIIFVSQLAS